MVTACIVLLYISYAIPITLLLMKGRDNIKHGPFWLGGLGLFANYVTLFWTAFTLIMYSFPYGKPVLPSSKSITLNTRDAGSRNQKLTRSLAAMNYVSAVYAVVFILIMGYWFLRGKHTFRSKDERAIEAEQFAQNSAVQ